MTDQNTRETRGPQPPPPAEIARPLDLGQLVSQLAEAMSRDLSSSEVAALRRPESLDLGALAFWKLALYVLEPAGALDPPPAAPAEARDEAARRWAALASGLAHLGPLHQPAPSLGAALARAEYSEQRLARLLRARGHGLLAAARAAARFLAAKGQPVDWADMADLVLSDGRDDQERVRRRVAWAFYAHPQPPWGITSSSSRPARDRAPLPAPPLRGGPSRWPQPEPGAEEGRKEGP